MAARKFWSQLVVITVVGGGLILAAGAPASGQVVQQATSQENLKLLAAPASGHAMLSNSQDEVLPNFPKRNFGVYNDGVKQTIGSVDSGVPSLSVAIVLETSSRVEGLLPAIRQTGILFTQSVLGPNGEAAVIGFNDEVNPLLDFTTDDDAIEKAVSNIQQGTSGTHLYDAMSQAAALLSSRPSGHRLVMVVMAEAVDTGSEANLNQVISEAQHSGITIYSVGLSSTWAELRGPQEPTAPLSATPPGVFALPPVPGSVQTPSTEALRAGNINFLPRVVWGVKRASAPLRDNPFEIAASATDGLYQSTFREGSIGPAIDKIGSELHTQ